MRRRHLRLVLLLAGLVAYAAAGLHREIRLIEEKPLSDFLIEDFTYYARALCDAIQTGNPYLVRDIGKAFIYPPQALVLLAPLLILGLAQPVFVVLLNTALAVALPLLIAHRLSVPLIRAWWWPVVALFFGPTLELIHIGQVNLLACIALVFMLHPRAVAAGAGFACAVLLKFTPVVFVAYVAAARRPRVTIWALTWAALPSIIVLVWLGPNVYLRYFDVLRSLLGNAQPSRLSAVGIVGHLDLQQFDAHWVATAVMGWCGLILTVSILAARINRDALPTYLISGFLLPVAPSIVWYHHFTFFLLPVFTWIALTGSSRVIAWSIAGLMLVQLDTTGLCAHAFAHLSALALLFGQITKFAPSTRDEHEIETLL